MKNSKIGTNLQKNSVEKSFKNYELGRLLLLNEGLTILFHHMFFGDPALGDSDYKALEIVLSMQSDVHEEIKLRFSESIQDYGFIEY